MAEVELGRDDEGTHLHYYYCKIKDWIQREIMFMFTYWSDRCTRWMSAPFWLILSPSSLFFFWPYFFGTPSFLSSSLWVTLLWHAIFPLFLIVGHASLACHLSSLFFRWREISSLRFWSIKKTLVHKNWIKKIKLNISLKGLKIW